MKNNELRNLIKKEVSFLLKENITKSSQITLKTDIEEVRAYVEQCLKKTEQKIIKAGKDLIIKPVIKQRSQAKEYGGIEGMAVKRISLNRQGFSDIKDMMRWYGELPEEFNLYLETKAEDPRQVRYALQRLKDTLDFLGF